MAATSLPRCPTPLRLLLVLGAAIGAPAAFAASSVATSRRVAQAKLMRSYPSAAKSLVEEAPEETLAAAWLTDLDSWTLVTKLTSGLLCSDEGASAVVKYVNEKGQQSKLIELNASIVDEGNKNKCVSVSSTPPHKMMQPSVFRPLCTCANMLELNIMKVLDKAGYTKKMRTWIPTRDHEITTLKKQWLDGTVNSWGLAEGMFKFDVCSRVAVQELVMLAVSEADKEKMHELDMELMAQMKAHAGERVGESLCLRRIDLTMTRAPEPPGPTMITPGINARVEEKEIDGMMLARKYVRRQYDIWAVGKRMYLINLCIHDFATIIVQEVYKKGEMKRLELDADKKVASPECDQDPSVCECVKILGAVAETFDTHL